MPLWLPFVPSVEHENTAKRFQTIVPFSLSSPWYFHSCVLYKTSKPKLNSNLYTAAAEMCAPWLKWMWTYYTYWYYAGADCRMQIFLDFNEIFSCLSTVSHPRLYISHLRLSLSYLSGFVGCLITLSWIDDWTVEHCFQEINATEVEFSEKGTWNNTQTYSFAERSCVLLSESIKCCLNWSFTYGVMYALCISRLFVFMQ